MAISKSDIKEKFLKAAAHLEHRFIKSKHEVKEKLHMLDPVMIMLYYGYGNDTCVFLKGRVIEKEKIKEKKKAPVHGNILRIPTNVTNQMKFPAYG